MSQSPDDWRDRIGAILVDRLPLVVDDDTSGARTVAGWGVVPDEGVSIVNTAEALLALSHAARLDLLDRYTIDSLTGTLVRNVSAELTYAQPRIRHLAYGGLALRLLGSEPENGWNAWSEALRGLMVAGHTAWPVTRGGPARLVPTFQALRALLLVDGGLEARDLRWLERLRRGSLCAFSGEDMSGNLGAGALTLWLGANCEPRPRWCEELANGVSRALPAALVDLERGDTSWVFDDAATGWKVYAYGHALDGLRRAGYDLLDQPVERLLRADAADDPGRIPTEPEGFPLGPRTTVPAILELAVARRAIEDDYDPVRYFLRRPSAVDLFAQERESELAALNDLARTLEMRQAILDSWERQFIRRESEFQRQVSGTLAAELDRRFVSRLAELRRSIVTALLLVFMCLCVISGFVGLLVEHRFGWIEWTALTAIVLGAIPVALELRRWRKAGIGQGAGTDVSNSSGERR